MKKNTYFKIVSVCILFFKFSNGFTQVGIGTVTPAGSSILDITSGNKGVLMPRITLLSTTDATTIPSPADGLLIWNNGLGGVSPSGFYFWSNSKWNQIATVSTVLPSSGNWSTSGNNAGNYGGNATNLSFGTSTYDDLIFKVNAANVGKLSVDGSLSFGNLASSKYQATAIGYNAIADNNESVAVGKNAFSGGYRSLALGFAAKTSNNNETALGYNSITSGQNSTALGSGASANGQNSTAIGYNASTSQYNAIVLGDSNANVGIGTGTPNNTAKLDVNGQYKLGNKGTVQKNQISFEVWPSVSINNLPSGKSTTMDIPLPPALVMTSAKATIVVTPANDFAGNSTFSISNPRLTSLSNITINLTNIAGNAESLYSAHFYVTINEF
ncbi:hypothetical protein EG349_03490 [Chryseobacterium shandongense]|uniref:Trimeric autotransporter adhesin YadA-like head domain-containing protein n=1 Tax=Chryseobacterium shandongense TaxID=1493872 RepID=A0AAD0YCH9_9FLAO|nr:hypothetical protein [Chryseobacterium shandongense]AZA85917.1 hypothetical protein EG349_03490 [Chryseobacterium shandongense]AZA94325.1 hypothetical protein EG353_01525 [Chryseobacterium shandongense]